jgi:hypothetical protein
MESTVSSIVPGDVSEDETKDTDSESAAPAGSGRFWCHVCRCVPGFGTRQVCVLFLRVQCGHEVVAGTRSLHMRSLVHPARRHTHTHPAHYPAAMGQMHGLDSSVSSDHLSFLLSPLCSP